MDDLFADLRNRIGDAVAQVEALAGHAGAPAATLGAILQGIQERAKRIE